MHQMDMPPMVIAAPTNNKWLNLPFGDVLLLMSSKVAAAPMRLTT